MYAAQKLSSSVEDALKFFAACDIDEFKGAKGTILFIRHIDRTFDNLNSKNPMSTGYRKPSFLANYESVSGEIVDLVNYLLGLKSKEGYSLIHHCSKNLPARSCHISNEDHSNKTC